MRMAAYCRVSTEKEEQLSSLANQREFFEQYANKEGDVLVRIYADEGISGKSMKKRDEFMQLLRDSETGAFDYVAVKDISRFARNTSDFLYGIRTLRSNGVDVRFLSSSRTVIGESEFILTVFAALAQEESANLSKRVIFGKRQNAKKGRVPNIVYGYNKIDTYTMEINDRESYVVQLMFRWYIQGDGTRRIAVKLNGMGIPTKKQAKWIPRTVHRILQNPIYIGKLINNKSVTKDFLSGTREVLPKEEWYVHNRPELRIISDEDFELVQKKIAQRHEQYKTNNHDSRYSSRHLFSNLIKCGECGKSFTARVYRWKNSYVRYRCCVHNNNGNAHCTNNVTVDEEKLLDAVKSYMLTSSDDKKIFFDKPVQVYKPQDSESANLNELKKRLEKRRDKFKEMFAEGIITIEELKKTLSGIDDAMLSIDDQLSEYNAKDSDNSVAENNIEKILMQNKYTNDDMRRIIEKIVVYPDRTIEIFMK